MKSGLVFYLLALGLLVFSLTKDRGKTMEALRKAWKSFENILPQFLSIIVLVSLLLAAINPETISGLIGKSSGWFGVFIASVVGSVTLIPGLLAFPTAALLLQGGAGYMQLGAFISTLMMVGVVTLPVEMSVFNRKTALMRNLLAYVFSLFVALVIGAVMSFGAY